MGKFRASDYFKSPNEFRAKAELGADYFYNRSVYSNNFVNTSYANKLANNSFSELVKDDSVAYIKLVDDDGSYYDFVKDSNNRLEMFYYKNYKHSYKEITKVEETTLDNVYTLKQLGYTEFYKIYKKNEYNVEYKLCNLAIKRA